MSNSVKFGVGQLNCFYSMNPQGHPGDMYTDLVIQIFV